MRSYFIYITLINIININIKYINMNQSNTETIVRHSNVISFKANSKADIFIDEYQLSTQYVVEVTEKSLKLDPSRRFRNLTSKTGIKEAVKTLDKNSVERVILENYDIPLDVAKCILTPYRCNLTEEEVKHITPISEKFFGNINYFKVKQH